jgi:hypothetical protein
MDANSAVEAVLAISSTVPPENQAAFKECLAEQFGLTSVVEGSGSIAVAEAVSEVPTFVSESAREAWGNLTGEQQEEVTNVQSGMAEHLEPLGVEAADVRFVKFEDDDGVSRFALVHGGQGIDIGDPEKVMDEDRSYNSVMSRVNDGVFRFEVDSKMYDTRTGMTDGVYRAKVEDIETDGNVTWTMLTGSSLAEHGYVRLRYVDAGRVHVFGAHPEYGFRSLRVCPAVVIEL